MNATTNTAGVDLDALEAIEHAARICESYCACDNGEDDEEINRILRNRAAQIRDLARRAEPSVTEATDERALFQREVLRLDIINDQGTWGGANSPEGWYYFDDEVNACWKTWQARAALIAYIDGRTAGTAEKWTERELSLLKFATRRFINHAYAAANEAGQDKRHKPETAPRLLEDAKDAEALIAKLMKMRAAPTPMNSGKEEA